MESHPAAAPTGSSVKTTSASVASQDASSLTNILSKVDMSPAELLSALSKVQGQGSLDGEKRNCSAYFKSLHLVYISQHLCFFSFFA